MGWDAIVVGGGFGGLTCAAYLATHGYRVLVAEQHDVAGGNGHVFRRRRTYEFDVGVHYLGDCGPNGTLPAVLSGLGLRDRVRFLPMDQDGFDRIVLPSLAVDVPTGWPRYRDRLVRALPVETSGIDEFIRICSSICDPVRTASVESLLANPELTGWRRRSLSELFDHCGLTPRARTVLAAQAGNYGAAPSKITVGNHLDMLDSYLRGAYYPEGGGQTMVAGLVEVLESHGGELRTRTPVAEILIEDGRARGVRLTDGAIEHAPLVVSNADYRATVLRLAGGARNFPQALIARTERAAMRSAVVVLYLGLDRRFELPNANLWWHPTEDVERSWAGLDAGEMPDTPSLFCSFASVKDPYSTTCPPGHSNLQLITLAPTGYPWGAGDYRRDSNYLAAKRRWAAAMLAAGERALGPLRGSIVHQELATPLTQRRYVGSSGGTPYGVANWGGISRRPSFLTPVAGLYVVGQSTRAGIGVAGTMIGGALCAGEILGRDVLSEVRAGTVFANTSLLPDRTRGWDPLRVSRGIARRDARGLARIDRR